VIAVDHLDEGYCVIPSGLIRQAAALLSAASAPSQAGESERDTIAMAVSKVLDEKIWPVCHMEDDRGLEEEEYVDFVIEVLAKVRALSVTGEARAGGVRALIVQACDLLAERKYGNPARSPAHNARLVLEAALSTLPAPEPQRGTEG
jgi:hypothetical protein